MRPLRLKVNAIILYFELEQIICKNVNCIKRLAAKIPSNNNLLIKLET